MRLLRNDLNNDAIMAVTSGNCAIREHKLKIIMFISPSEWYEVMPFLCGDRCTTS